MTESALSPGGHRASASMSASGRWAGYLEYRTRVLALGAVVAIAIGWLLHLVGEGDAGHLVWAIAVGVLAADLTYEVVRTVVVDRHLGVDTIALLAMVGSLALGEELAGIVVGLMFTGQRSRRRRRGVRAGS
jgi:hypothetical protein